MTRPSASRRLLAESGPARGYLAATVASGLIVTGLILVQAGLLARALATASTGFGVAALAGVLVALLAVVIARAAVTHGGEATALRAAAAVKERMRSRLVARALELGPAWLGRQRAGEMTTLATGGLDSLDPYFARFVPQAILAVTVPVAVVATVTASDWISGLIIAVTLPLIPVFAVLIGLHTKAQVRRNWQLLARLSGHFLDVVQGLATLKVFGRAKEQERVIARVTGEYRISVMSSLRVAFLSALVLELSAALATALVAVEVGLRLLYGHIGYEPALLVLLLTPEAYLPLRGASAQYHASADGTAAAERVFEILDTGPVEVHGRPDRRGRGHEPLPDLRSAIISIDALSVTHPGRPKPVLAGADLDIGPGEWVTLTGANGAGKSTLLSVLLKFTEPSGGSVSVGGIRLADVPAGAWRDQIGWLPQRPALFPWTVAENIALGRPQAPRCAIRRAAVMAGAHDFIAALPDGYDTALDEGARRLSAGQRQKLALARLFLLDRPLLLLDEPTAHLDRASAAEVGAAIGAIGRGRTIVLVTHQVMTAAGRGRTVELADGRITERGLPAAIAQAATRGMTASTGP